MKRAMRCISTSSADRPSLAAAIKAKCDTQNRHLACGNMPNSISGGVYCQPDTTPLRHSKPSHSLRSASFHLSFCVSVGPDKSALSEWFVYKICVVCVGGEKLRGLFDEYC